ncbi:MAG: deoxyribodipyrimidine photo-lyase, partial [Flavobacteriales bacterium]|nr:deoxyribodipyrimidine photo-lyase [Flavobacteriales bacterium]
MIQPLTLFWHRRDLRTEDNAGLYHALKGSTNVQPIFIFDTDILDKLPNYDRRVDFIHQSLESLRKNYQNYGSELWVFFGKPKEVFEKLTESHSIQSVYTNRDYEPYARKRDQELFDFFETRKIQFKGFKDHVIFEKSEITKADGLPYTVFTPYAKKWKEKLSPFYFERYSTEKHLKNLHQTVEAHWKTLIEIGFEKTDIAIPPPQLSDDLIDNYKATRDFPAKNGTTKLSVHLRFGTISIRQCVAIALQTKSESWHNELIWRDFYHTILYHFPRVERSFKPKYDFIEWRNNETEFEVWCKGQTGYPIVDAGMRELNQTGFMHNRVRMVVASFLVKHLLIDWRWGEAYFAEKLLDFDLAANNG